MEGGEVELGQFDKHFFKSTKKRGSARKDFGNFSPNTLKTTFWKKDWKILPKDGHNQGLSFQNHDTLRPPLSVPVSVTEYASISLNIHKNPWNELNKLFWICQGSEYAWLSFMVDKLLKMPRILNKQSSEYAGTD